MKLFPRPRTALAAVVPLAALAVVAAQAATAAPQPKTTLSSAVALNTKAETITLPVFQGKTSTGAATWYVVIDSSSKTDAAKRGVNYAPLLGKAAGTRAVEQAKLDGSTVVFPGTVNFAPKRVVVPSDTGFPPTKVAPGAVGDKLYSPLITTGGGVVLDAPQIKNASGQSDTVVNFNLAKKQVTLQLLRGFFDGTPVLYVRTDGSSTLVSALEASTFTPNLDATPASATSAIIPVVNGPRGKTNPARQGLQSAVLGEGDPLNITQSFPGAANYSPVWELHPVVWTAAAIKAGKQTQLTSPAQVAADLKAGLLTSLGTGAPDPSIGGVKAIGMISICSTVAIL